MTLEELKKNWKKYALTLIDGQTIVMRKAYTLVATGGEFKGELLFEMKDELFKGRCDLFGVDENNICYTKISVNTEFVDFWVPIGKFVKLKPRKKKGRVEL